MFRVLDSDHLHHWRIGSVSSIIFCFDLQPPQFLVDAIGLEATYTSSAGRAFRSIWEVGTCCFGVFLTAHGC
jgi:hypothetical protein